MIKSNFTELYAPFVVKSTAQDLHVVIPKDTQANEPMFFESKGNLESLKLEVQDGAKLCLVAYDLPPHSAIYVGAHASLELYTPFEGEISALGVKIYMAKDATLRGLSLISQKSTIDFDFFLEDQGTHLSFDHLMILENQKVNLRSFIYHKSQFTTSSQKVKAIVAHGGDAKFSGHIIIPPGSRKACANMQTSAKVLDIDSSISFNPSLEVDTDDVKCAHGASVGQLRPEEIFYLMARGISRHEAISLLNFGFIKEMLMALPTFLRPRLESRTRSLVERMSLC